MHAGVVEKSFQKGQVPAGVPGGGGFPVGETPSWKFCFPFASLLVVRTINGAWRQGLKIDFGCGW